MQRNKDGFIIMSEYFKPIKSEWNIKSLNLI